MKPRRFARTMMVLTAGVALGVAGSAAYRATFPTPAAPPAEASSAIESALDRPVPDVNLADVPLNKAAAEIGRLAGVRIEFDDENRLRGLGTPLDVPFTHKSRNETLAELLDRLAFFGSGSFDYPAPHLEWAVERDQILLTDRGTAVPGLIVTRVYDVRDVLARMVPAMQPNLPPDFKGGSIFFNPRDPERELVEFLSEAIAGPRVFMSPDPGPGIRLVEGRLIVSDTYSLHCQVRQLLDHLRQPPASTALLPRRPDVFRWRGDARQWTRQTVVVDEAKLRDPIPEFRVDDTTVRAAVERWSAAAGIAAVFDPAGEQKADFDQPVKAFGLRGAPAHEVLRAILDGGGRRLDPGGQPVWPDAKWGVLSWWYEGERVVIGLQFDAGLHTITRAYDLGEWLDAAYAAAGARLPDERGPVRDAATRQLVEQVTEAVAPNSWQHSGGSYASVREVGGQLLVTQTPENQLAVERVIRDTRRAGAATRPTPP